VANRSWQLKNGGAGGIFINGNISVSQLKRNKSVIVGENIGSGGNSGWPKKQAANNIEEIMAIMAKNRGEK
jgi:hypothetical protein